MKFNFFLDENKEKMMVEVNGKSAKPIYQMTNRECVSAFKQGEAIKAEAQKQLDAGETLKGKYGMFQGRRICLASGGAWTENNPESDIPKE
jgi:hypothetical protein